MLRSFSKASVGIERGEALPGGGRQRCGIVDDDVGSGFKFCLDRDGYGLGEVCLEGEVTLFVLAVGSLATGDGNHVTVGSELLGHEVTDSGACSKDKCDGGHLWSLWLIQQLLT